MTDATPTPADARAMSAPSQAETVEVIHWVDVAVTRSRDAIIVDRSDSIGEYIDSADVHFCDTFDDRCSPDHPEVPGFYRWEGFGLLGWDEGYLIYARGGAWKNLTAEIAEGATGAGNARVGEGWQPIETAPKDGTQVDLWVSAPGTQNGGVRVCDAAWLSGKWRALADHDEHDYEPQEGFEWFANFGPSVPVETDICRATLWMRVAPPSTPVGAIAEGREPTYAGIPLSELQASSYHPGDEA